jgi:cyclophilin family peptidyl-prolyl cis-trans isomerase
VLTKARFARSLAQRVVADFVAQTGDPLGDGSGGESIYGPYFEDEIVARLSHNRKGILAMANAGRNTNSSQFFFTLRAAPHLDGKHTVFGQVTDDTLAVLDDISRVPTKDKVPTKPVKIFSATVTEDPWRGQPLPAGASIPEKPLVGTQSKCAVQ